jgi:hypothetical protein
MIDFEGLNTSRLSDVYGEWLAENGFEGHEPADELLMFSKELANRQREWLEDFCAAFKAQEKREACALICDRWAKWLGLSWHIDTRAEEYLGDMPEAFYVEYENDMDYLRNNSSDPYADAIAAWERAGIISKGE